ncbi:RNA-dependent RNA polymerase [Hapavirus ngaingan]|uniref:Replicase n=2 Tax=Hapavirus ngaingan TaxID=1972623 RepID=D3GGM2_9RHAB|nr:RNA-dependent RNA polymerase [Hapavirus ngaingan]ACX83613.1 RNA-dependent RNA polymerase [Hapavirus ngaingan]
MEYLDEDIWSTEETDLLSDHDVIDEFDLDQSYMDDQIEESMEFINRFDYTLNSPIILDHVVNLIEYCNDGPYEKIFFKSSWPTIAQIIKKHKIRLNQCTSSYIDNIYKYIFSELMYKRPDDYKFKEILNESFNGANDTLEILRAFLRGWLGNEQEEDWNISLLYNQSEHFWIWSELFWECYHLVLLLNSTGKKEDEKLKKIISFKSYCPEQSSSFKILDTQFFGQVCVIDCYIIMIQYGIILDRNCILMIKDMCLARSQTIISIIYDDKDYGQDDKEGMIQRLTRVYCLGDQYLSILGNDGYEGIKCLEPMCNSAFCDLAHKFRPLIPRFQDFKTHVENSTIEKDRETGFLCEIKRIVDNAENVEEIIVYYSIFRHWGHPSIKYLEGLKKLEQQVNMKKEIDDDYAQSLASDLAYKVLKKHFFEKKTWGVSLDDMDPKHPLYKHIKDNLWPNQFVIDQFGDNWHKLPIIKIYDIPDFLDPSLIYSDKSHSMSRSEIISHVHHNPNKPIPTRRVLSTLLNREATNWAEFLQRINDEGLPRDCLAIGLKAKEREVKLVGRFFSLMTWELREYFVCTEYMIKQFFIPLFQGLTMADDMQEVLKKLLSSSSGQGLDNYNLISIANHFDYEKWNNHQRYASNCHVFKVMGQCFGLPNLFLRTHEFFEKSLIYYANRPDLMMVQGDSLINRTEHMVCWEGQKGGLEGLRQKGWSGLNLLVIEREAKIRNTKLKILAQGDNQVISSFYSINFTYNEDELIRELNKIVQNNRIIMNAIREGANKLGLIINEDETMVSADFLSYGKTPIFRGVIKGLDPKRWSRVNCTTNDQLPSIGNTLATVSTNALTVSHFSNSPLNAMRLHNLFGNIVVTIILHWNPALRDKPADLVKHPQKLTDRRFRAGLLYLDPGLGGIGGTSLTRFLIRDFPDPITESLSFWKLVYENTVDPLFKSLAASVGHPQLEQFEIKHLSKLLEDPNGLNIKRGISSVNMLKNEVRKNLLLNVNNINNIIIRSAIEYLLEEEQSLMSWIMSIKPLFPRFTSELCSATYYGITNSILGLFQNSKTIRNSYRKLYHQEIDQIIIKSEIIGMSSLLKHIGNDHKEIWDCSSGWADELRLTSWGEKVFGTTVPHPIEILATPKSFSNYCPECLSSTSNPGYVTVMVPYGLAGSKEKRGPFPPYLGSRTSETTSLIQPWEKETNIPLVKRAAKLRKAISWFIEPDTKLANSILNNIESLTGENWAGLIKGFKRTGSALHRWSCSRVSNGGFSATSPSCFSWMICTTDTLSTLNDKNYDFMFQSLLIHSQVTTSAVIPTSSSSIICHFHLKCNHCIREIQDIWIDSEWEYHFPNKSNVVAAWRPGTTNWGESKVSINMTKGNWDSVKQTEKCFLIGQIMGFIFSDMLLSHSKHVSDSSLFPIGLANKLIGRSFLDGIYRGIRKSCSLQLIHRRNLLEGKKPKVALWGSIYYNIERLSETSGFLALVRSGSIIKEVESHPHKPPSSYPLNNMDLGSVIRSYFKFKLNNALNPKSEEQHQLWIFADTESHDIVGSFLIGHLADRLIMNMRDEKTFKDKLRSLQELYINMKANIWSPDLIEQIQSRVFVCEQEVRHASKEIVAIEDVDKNLSWGKEYTGSISSLVVNFGPDEEFEPSFFVPRRQHPLIAGLRTFQMATGAHYKVRTILQAFGIDWNHALVGGDGSGGISAYLCRSNPLGKVVFNSLLVMEGIDFKGSHPSPPSAITEIGSCKSACINYTDVWKYSSDLSRLSTWQYFEHLSKTQDWKPDLMIFDMEVNDLGVMSKIEALIMREGIKLLCRGGTLIFKTYLGRLINTKQNIINLVGSYFFETTICQTSLSSSFTSEVYVVFSKLLDKPKHLKFLRVDEVIEFAKQSYCFSNFDKELTRGRKLHKDDLFIGVPKELQSDITTDLSTLLGIVGMHYGYSVSISRSWLHHRLKKSGLSYLISILSLLGESIIPTTAWMREEFNPPTINELENLFGVYIGIISWIAVATGNTQLFGHTYESIEKELTFNYMFKKGKKGFRITWSINTCMEKKKTFRLNSKMALAGQVIRLAQRMFGSDITGLDIQQIESILQFYNKGLTVSHMIKNTGLYRWVEYI